jgi:phosphatidylglycerol:prolipoprotein diacylglycerol transferase
LWVHTRKRYDGQVFAVSMALYAVARFLVEFFRRDDRGGLVGLSTSQLLGIAMLAVALAVHIVRGRRPVVAA